MNAHRLPCVDGSVCGEPAHCPPLTTEGLLWELLTAAQALKATPPGDLLMAAFGALERFVSVEVFAHEGVAIVRARDRRIRELLDQRNAVIAAIRDSQSSWSTIQGNGDDCGPMMTTRDSPPRSAGDNA